MLLKPINSFAITVMLGFALVILFSYGFLDFPSASSSIPSSRSSVLLNPKSTPDSFKDLLGAFRRWDSQVGCYQFREMYIGFVRNGSTSLPSSSLQQVDGELECSELKMNHVGVLVKGWTWIPDNLDNLYSCRCGLSCLWTKSPVLVDKPDALFYETTTPPLQKRRLLDRETETWKKGSFWTKQFHYL